MGEKYENSIMVDDVEVSLDVGEALEDMAARLQTVRGFFADQDVKEMAKAYLQLRKLLAAFDAGFMESLKDVIMQAAQEVVYDPDSTEEQRDKALKVLQCAQDEEEATYAPEKHTTVH